MSQHDGAKTLKKAQGLLQQGYLKDALKILARLAADMPETPGLNTTYGTALASAGRWAMASTYLKKALQNHLDQPDVLNNLAICHRGLGKYREGLDNLEYALRLAPRFVDAWINKGNLHNDLQEPAKAALCFARAVALKPEDSGPWRSLVYSHLTAGQADKALDLSRQAQKRFPTEAAFIAAEVAALQALDKQTEALQLARQWEQQSQSPEAIKTCLQAARLTGQAETLIDEKQRLKSRYGQLPDVEASAGGPDPRQHVS